MLFQSSRKNIPGEQDPANKIRGSLVSLRETDPSPFPSLSSRVFSRLFYHTLERLFKGYLPLTISFFIVSLSPTRELLHRLPISHQKPSSQSTYLPLECLFTGYLSPTRKFLHRLPIFQQNAFSQATYLLLETFFLVYLSPTRMPFHKLPIPYQKVSSQATYLPAECLFTGYLSPTRNLLPSLPISHQNAFSQATYPPLESFFTGYKNEKSEDYSKADLKQRVLFFITIFRLAIPAFFRFTDVTGYLSSSRMPFHRLPIFY